MKNKILKVIPIIFILLGFLSVNTYAVTYTSTDSTVKSEENITITVKASEKLQNYDLTLTSYTGLTYISCSANENAAVNSSTGSISYATLGSGTETLGTYKFKAPKVTKDTTYDVKFNINGTSNTAKVTVKAETPAPTTPTKPQEPTPTTPTKPQEPTPTTPTKPTFKTVSETVYASSTVNVRKSYSTSSEVLGSLNKGESLTRTGLGSNGWSEVTYKGTTAYISTQYLTTTKPEEEKKSDNAYLKSLTVENQELIPAFNKETTSYTMQVSNDITELDIKAEAEDEKATVEIQGNKDLKDGENTVTVSVNAEDNTIKIYEIKVTKSEKTELGLKTLTIEGTDITDDFKPEVYEYKIDIEDVEKLKIEAIPNDEKAVVEILGNEDLQEGENTITIIVSSQDGSKKVTYQITANKTIEKQVSATVEETNQLFPKMYFYIALGVVVLLALIIVIVYTIRHRNTDEYEFSDNFGSFSEESPQKDENSTLFSSNDKEETKELDINNEKIQNYEPIDENKDKKAKIDYFVDDEEENEKPRRKKGKHF